MSATIRERGLLKLTEGKSPRFHWPGRVVVFGYAICSGEGVCVAVPDVEPEPAFTVRDLVMDWNAATWHKVFFEARLMRYRFPRSEWGGHRPDASVVGYAATDEDWEAFGAMLDAWQADAR